jgi:hypothetical protein
MGIRKALHFLLSTMQRSYIYHASWQLVEKETLSREEAKLVTLSFSNDVVSQSPKTNEHSGFRKLDSRLVENMGLRNPPARRAASPAKNTKTVG